MQQLSEYSKTVVICCKIGRIAVQCCSGLRHTAEFKVCFATLVVRSVFVSIFFSYFEKCFCGVNLVRCTCKK